MFLSYFWSYSKNLRNWDTYNKCLKKLNSLVFSAIMHVKDADGTVNSGDPDQTVPEGAV